MTDVPPFWHTFCEDMVNRMNRTIIKQLNKHINIMAQKGNIGVTTENIFPVIKKFLYSECKSIEKKREKRRKIQNNKVFLHRETF